MPYFVKRLAWIPVSVGVIFTILFLLVHCAPGDPMAFVLSPESRTPAHALAQSPDSLWNRYVTWWSRLARLDLGTSRYYQEPVREVILERLGVSAALGALTFFLTYVIGIPIGVFTAVARESRSAKIVDTLALALYCTPSFVLALLVLNITGDRFPLLFAAAVLAASGMPGVARLTRFSLEEQFSKPHLATARAKGLSDARVLWHAFVGARIGLARSLSQWTGFFLTGSVVLESLFGLQGMGRLGFDSLLRRDYPVILALLCAGVLAALAGNLLADGLLQKWDPKLSFEAKNA